MELKAGLSAPTSGHQRVHVHRIALTLCSALFLAGCGHKDNAPGGEGGSIELTYWPAPNAQEVQLADTLVQRWNRLHPGVHVRMQPIPVSQSTEEVLLAAIAGKTTPDVCSNIWPGALHEYTQAGGLIALDSFRDFDSVATSRTPRELLKTFGSSDGHFYQLPWKTNPVMMFYNVRLLKEAGVNEVPATYSAYLAAGQRVTRDTNGDGQIDVWMGERDVRPIWWQRLFDFYPFYIAASGGRTLFADQQIAFENDAAVDVFGFFQACYGRHYFPRTFFQGGDPFFLELKATHFAGPWQVAAIQKFAPTVQFGVAPLPVPDNHQGPVYTSGDFKNIAIFGNTRHRAEAWEFVKFLVSPEHDLLLLEISNQIPVRGDLLDNPLFADYFRRNPVMVSFARQAPYTRGMDSAPDLKEIFDAIAQEYEISAVFGRKTPADAIHDAAQRVRSIVEWNK
jgi:multiple sugar transport system substrate-binding protein